MSNTNVEIVQELLKGATKPEVVNRLVSPDAIYVSLTYNNPDLKKLMPWAGTHKEGPASVLKVFQELNTFWMIEDLEVQDAFGEGENVALFGTFTTHSVKHDRLSSPVRACGSQARSNRFDPRGIGWSRHVRRAVCSLERGARDWNCFSHECRFCAIARCRSSD